MRSDVRRDSRLGKWLSVGLALVVALVAAPRVRADTMTVSASFGPTSTNWNTLLNIPSSTWPGPR